MESIYNTSERADGDKRRRLADKRRRLWDEFDADQRRRVLESCRFEPKGDDLAPFAAMVGASAKVLYAAYMAGYPRNAAELRYLLLERWQTNLDLNTIRARAAQLTMREMLRSTAEERFAITEAGRDELRELTRRWLREQARAIRAENRERGAGAPTRRRPIGRARGTRRGDVGKRNRRGQK